MDGLLQSPRRLPPTGRGQEDSARLSSSQSPGRSYKEAFPRRLFRDLTPCCSGAGEGLTHFYLTLTPAPGAQAWPKGGTPGPVPQSLDKPSPEPSLSSTVGSWRHRVKGHLVPLLKEYE